MGAVRFGSKTLCNELREDFVCASIAVNDLGGVSDVEVVHTERECTGNLL